MKAPGKKAAKLVAAPDVPPPESLTLMSALELVHDEQYEEFCLRDGVATADARGFSINCAVFSKSRVSAWDIAKSKLTDVKFEQCDMSNQSWMQSKFLRVEVSASKLTGFKFVEGFLSDVKFDQCNSSIFQLFGTELKNVMFHNCALPGADFSSCKLENVVFRNCELQGAIFHDAKMSAVDFRRSNLSNFKAHAADLRGAIIDREQLIEMAEQFAGLLGVQIS